METNDTFRSNGPRGWCLGRGIGFLLGLLLAGRAAGQTVLHTFPGTSAGDSAGYSVSGVGDADGDGYDDVLVGIPNASVATLYSGQDGSVLYSYWGGPSGQQSFGWSVASAGDLDMDGSGDFLVGDPARWLFCAVPLGTDSVSAFSGIDGSSLWMVTAPAGDDFGSSVAAAGDVDGDGSPDVVVGAVKPFGPTPGYAQVLDANGNALCTVFGTISGSCSTVSSFGTTVDGAGDVDSDGNDDFIVGEFGSSRIYGGPSCQALPLVIPLGPYVSGAGDVDSDGRDDVIVGDGLGSASVFRGHDASVIHAFAFGTQGDGFGSAVSGHGDLNRDGHAELVVGAPQWSIGSGFARTYSGKDGSILCTATGAQAGDEFGHAVSAGYDVDGDGFEDLIVGAPQSNLGGAGYAQVVSGIDTQSLSGYGAGLAGSGGAVPSLVGIGCAQIGATPSLYVSNALGGAVAFHVLGIAMASIPALGGTLLVGSPWMLLPVVLGGASGASQVGSHSLPLGIPNNPTLSGASVFVQTLVVDPGAPAGVSMTNGLQVTIQ